MSAPVPPLAYHARWLAFCRAHGVTPDKAGLGVEYVPWVHGKWAEFDAIHGTDSDHRTEAEHAAFTAWLDEQVPA